MGGGQGNASNPYQPGGMSANPYAAMQGRVPAAMQAFQQARQQQMNALYPQMDQPMTKSPMGQPGPLPPMGAGGAMPSLGTTIGLPAQMAIRDMYTSNPGATLPWQGLLGRG